MVDWLSRVFRSLTAQSDYDVVLSHFLLQLNNDFLVAQNPVDEEPVKNMAVAKTIASLIPPQGSHCDWTHAYEIERLLVFLKTPRQLALDADRKVADVERRKLPTAQKLRERLNSAVGTLDAAKAEALNTANDVLNASSTAPNLEQLKAIAAYANDRLSLVTKDVTEERRIIMAAALDDLQWFFQKRIAVRKALLESAKNVTLFGTAIIFIVASPFLMFVFERVFEVTWFSNLVPDFPNYGLYTAMSFGLLGAFFQSPYIAEI